LAEDLSHGSLYLFDNRNTIYYTTSIAEIGFNEYLDVPCLLDMDDDHRHLLPLLHSHLSLLQAASSTPVNTAWTKRRLETITFVLNPPSEEEIIHASVFYPLFLRP